MQDKFRFLIFLVFILIVQNNPSSSYADIVINEIVTDAVGSDTGNEWIELYNNGASAVNITGWEIDCDIAPYYTFPSFTLQPSSYVVIHLRTDGMDTQEDFYTGASWSSSNMGNSSGQVALYNSSSHAQANSIDFVEWGATGQTHESQAINVSQWPGIPDIAPTVSAGHSIEYDGAGNSGADWIDQANPTQGADNSLPVFLSSFSTSIINQGIAIRWTTASEVDNYGYYLYRRISSEVELIKISNLIPGAGNSPWPNDYEYIDMDAEIGKTYYYQLEDLDFNGDRTRHPTVSIKYVRDGNSNQLPKTFEVSSAYPNPFGVSVGYASTALKIYVPNDKDITNMNISVFNIFGQEVFSFPEQFIKPGEYIFLLNQRDLFEAGGVYIWKVQMGRFQEVRKVTLIR